MATYDLLVLDSVPRERGALQAKLNEARYAKRRARRRRWLLLLALAVVLACGAWLAIFGPASVPRGVYQAVAVTAALVFCGSVLRSCVRLLARSRAAVAMPMPVD